MTDSNQTYTPSTNRYFNFGEDADAKADLFILDNEQDFGMPNPYYAATLEDDLTKSKATNIPYIPQAIGGSGYRNTGAEYVPSSSRTAKKTVVDDTDSPFTPYAPASSSLTASVPNESDTKRGVKRAHSESVNPLAKHLPNLPLPPTVSVPTPKGVSRSNSLPGCNSGKTKSAASSTLTTLPPSGVPSSSPNDDDTAPGKKARVAHTPSYDPTLLPAKTVRKKVGGRQYLRNVMEERYKLYKKQKEQTKSTPKSSATTSKPAKVSTPPIGKSVSSLHSPQKNVKIISAYSQQQSSSQSTSGKVNQISTQSTVSKGILIAKAIGKPSSTPTLPRSNLMSANVVLKETKVPETKASPKKYQATCVEKGNARIAHVPAKTPPQLKLMPIPESSSKLPLIIRANTLKKFYAELTVGLLDPNDPLPETEVERLTEQAREYEHEVCLRAKNNKSIYTSLGASKVQIIRRERGTTAMAASAAMAAKTGKKFRALKSTAPTIPMPKVSHDALLNSSSKARNCSVLSKEKLKVDDLTSDQLVFQLTKLTIPAEKLAEYGFPQRHSDGAPGHALLTNSAAASVTRPVVYKDGMRLTCRRCQKEYSNPQADDGSSTCVYHNGRIFKFRDRQGLERQYICCRGDPQSGGCASSPYHVTEGYEFWDAHNGFACTLNGALSGKVEPGVFAIDCEMCYSEQALELTRVTLLNFEGKVIYESFVKPESRILDYNTKFSGIKEGDLDNVTTTLYDVQKELQKRISSQSIIIGHGLDSDFRVLKLWHDNVVDTTHLFPHKQGLPKKRSLKNLTCEYLKKIIQDSVEGHDSNEDARAALELVKLKLQDELNKWLTSPST